MQLLYIVINHLPSIVSHRSLRIVCIRYTDKYPGILCDCISIANLSLDIFAKFVVFLQNILVLIAMTRQHIFDQRLCLRHDKCILVLLPVHLRKIWCKCLCTIFFAKVLVQKALPIVAASQTMKAIPEEQAFLEKWVNVVDYE